MLPDFEPADRIGEFSGTPKTGTLLHHVKPPEARTHCPVRPRFEVQLKCQVGTPLFLGPHHDPDARPCVFVGTTA